MSCCSISISLNTTASQETHLTLADITDLIRPDLAGGKTSVQRSNSSIGVGCEWDGAAPAYYSWNWEGLGEGQDVKL